MKKVTRIAVGVALAATVTASAAALAGCAAPQTTGEAYGLVHGGSYVGYAKISVKGDKVEDLTLTEVCLPTQVTATEDVAEADKVTVNASGKITYYYKTLGFADKTWTYDAADNDYKDGAVALKTYLQTEANAKAYYEAVMNGSLTVTADGAQKKDVMTKAALSKEENGYWTREDKDGNSYSRWKYNRDATVNYVKSNGVGNLKKLVKSETAATDPKTGADAYYWMDGEISTGASWNDLNNSDKKGKVYLTYAELIVNAYNAKN